MDFIKKNWVFLLIGLLSYRWYIGKQADVPFGWNLKQFDKWNWNELRQSYLNQVPTGPISSGVTQIDFTGDGSTINSTIGA